MYKLQNKGIDSYHNIRPIDNYSLKTLEIYISRNMKQLSVNTVLIDNLEKIKIQGIESNNIIERSYVTYNKSGYYNPGLYLHRVFRNGQ